jgi:hypothetical protein
MAKIHDIGVLNVVGPASTWSTAISIRPSPGASAPGDSTTVARRNTTRSARIGER